MNEQDELIRRLSFENIIWITFIAISAVDIYGDELIKKSVRNNDLEARIKAENIFLFVSLISLLVYVYFFYRNYTDYKKYQNKNYEIRLIGSIFVLAGTLCLFYFQLNNNSSVNDDLPSNI